MVTEGRAAGIKVGDAGLTESVLRPAGRARIGGRSVDVVADGKYIEPGQPIKVVEVRGNRLIVVPLDPT
jgi:membrane-bound serine protease (ClpP class)